MDIYLDNDRLGDARADTLAEAIEAARARAATRERVIVDVIVDGSPLPPEGLDDAGLMGGGCSEVRLTSAEPRAFVRVTLQDAAEALRTAQEDQRQAAAGFEAGETTDAFAALERAISVWQAARQSLDQGAQLLGLDLASVPTGDAGSLPEAIGALSTGLEEVRRAVQAQDWAGLSDVLLYDFDGLAERWRTLLLATADHVTDAGDPA